MTPPRTLADWRGLLQHAATQFDARSRRERVLMGAAAVALAFMLADALWLTPALRQFQAARQAERQATTALESLRADGERLRAQSTAEAQARQAELATWRERVRAADARLREHQAALVAPDQMVGLLEQMIAGHAVRVRALQTLPRTDLLADPASAPGATPPAPSAPATQPSPSAPGTPGAQPSLYRHGVELTLEGSYADLVAWLRAVEALPQRLLWGGVQFKVEQYPKATLTLRLHTLSLEHQWLQI